MIRVALALLLTAAPLSAGETRHTLLGGVAEITLPERFAPAVTRDDFVSFETERLIDSLIASGDRALLAQLQDTPLPFAEPAPQTAADCPEKVDLTTHPLCRPAAIIFLHRYDLNRTQRFFNLASQLSYDLIQFRRDWLGANVGGILTAYCNDGPHARVETERAQDGSVAYVECFENGEFMPVTTLTRLAITTGRRETAVSVTGMLGDAYSGQLLSQTSEEDMQAALDALNAPAAVAARLAEFERVFESLTLTAKAASE